MTQTQTQPIVAAPVAQPKYVTRNGKVVQALDRARMDAILNGTLALDRNAVGIVLDKIIVQGEGTHLPARPTASGKIAPATTIYNVNLRSAVAYEGPKYNAAMDALEAAEAVDDTEKVHDACNDAINAVRISFNSNTKFSKGDLVKGVLTLITTENGSLLRLENVSVMAAQSVASVGTKGPLGRSKPAIAAPAAAAAAAPAVDNAFATAQ